MTLPERLQDVVAEMRFECCCRGSGTCSYCRWADRIEAAALSERELPKDLLLALTALSKHGALDNVYDVRERIDFSELKDGESSWDHPDVKEYSAACEVVERYIAAAPVSNSGGEG